MRQLGESHPPDATRQVLGWVTFTGTGTPAIFETDLATSITDGGVGLWTITWARDVSSSTAYAVMGAARNIAANNATCHMSTRTGFYNGLASNAIQTNEGTANALADVSYASLVLVGAP